MATQISLGLPRTLEDVLVRERRRQRAPPPSPPPPPPPSPGSHHLSAVLSESELTRNTDGGQHCRDVNSNWDQYPPHVIQEAFRARYIPGDDERSTRGTVSNNPGPQSKRDFNNHDASPSFECTPGGSTCSGSPSSSPSSSASPVGKRQKNTTPAARPCPVAVRERGGSQASAVSSGYSRPPLSPVPATPAAPFPSYKPQSASPLRFDSLDPSDDCEEAETLPSARVMSRWSESASDEQDWGSRLRSLSLTTPLTKPVATTRNGHADKSKESGHKRSKKRSIGERIGTFFSRALCSP